MNTSPEATYRGYRKQALYVLWRVLKDDGELMFRPEVGEDLAVYRSDSALVETIQVKDYVGPLALSDFKPDSKIGFFARLDTRLNEHPNTVTTIATFGDLGPELRAAIESPGTVRDDVARKLHAKNPDISEERALQLLSHLSGNILPLHEGTLRDDIDQVLGNTVAGSDITSGTKLLLYWIYECSERRMLLTRQQLLGQLERVATFLSTTHARFHEWQTSISPIVDEHISESDTHKLRVSFNEGVDATWRHILADADTPRNHLLGELRAHFLEVNLVLIRGPSGYGKSALAWRYIRENTTDHQRFHIRRVASRNQALRIASLIREHARSLNMKPLVYLDVPPGEVDWGDLLELLGDANVRILVTVREEDYRRSGLSRFQIHRRELRLSGLVRQEAATIYSQLEARHESAFLNFEDAWPHFVRQGGGAILEFTHFATKRDPLAQRIALQVAALQSEPGEPSTIRLLALCAVAHAAGVSVSLPDLLSLVGVDPLSDPLKRLENEYLVRIEGPSSQPLVSPVHTLRSQHILDILLKDTPNLIQTLVRDVLNLVADYQVETFLLTWIERQGDDAYALVGILPAPPPKSWCRIAQILQALLWFGISEYERVNRNGLKVLIGTYGPAYWLIGEVIAYGDASRLFSRIKGKDINARNPLSPCSEIFGPVTAWLKQIQLPVDLPTSARDWAATSDIFFWSGHCGVIHGLNWQLEQYLESALSSDLSVQDLAHVISGAAEYSRPVVAKWEARHRDELHLRFCSGTFSLYLEDDGLTVKAYYPVRLPLLLGEQGELKLNDESMKRVNLLRQLFPARVEFGAEALTFGFFDEILKYDPSGIRIAGENVHLRQTVEINARLRATIDYRHRRPPSWDSYLHSVQTFRQATTKALYQTTKAWKKWLQVSTLKPEVPLELLGQLASSSKAPMLPRIAVDPWGHNSEATARLETDPSDGFSDPTLKRFNSWNKTYSRVRTSIETAATHIQRATNGFLQADGVIPSSQLVYINLDTAWENLEEFQREFRSLFATRLRPNQLHDLLVLEQREQELISEAWMVSFALYSDSESKTAVLSNPADFLEELTNQFLESIARHLTSATFHIHKLPRELLIQVDHNSLPDVAERTRTLTSVLKATQFRKWKNLEWTPLIRRWDAIRILHTVRSKYVLPSTERLSTSLAFNSGGKLEVGFAHLVQHPLDEDTFRGLRLLRHNSPLIEALSTWYESLTRCTLAVLFARGLIAIEEDNKVDKSAMAPLEIHFETFLGENIQSLLDRELVLEKLLSGHSLVRQTNTLSELTIVLSAAIAARKKNSISCPAYVETYTEQPEKLGAHIESFLGEALSISS